MTQRSDHFDGQRFFNPASAAPQPFSAVPRMLMEPKTPWPREVPVVQRQPPPLQDAAAVVTFIGHSTFLIQTAAGNIITDPVFSSHAGPFGRLGPRRVRRPAIRLQDLPEISVVLLSHNHYDHCDLPSLRVLARRYNPLVVTPLGNEALVRSAGLRRIDTLDWWQDATQAPFRVTLTPARHFSARTPFDRNTALWGGFVFEAGGLRVYFAGDSAYATFFRDVSARCGPLDLALLPIGAYEPRWFMQAVHMNPEEAVQAHIDLGSPPSIGMHFGTFQLTTEGIDAPIAALAAACRAHGIPDGHFRTLDFGGSLSIAD